MAEAKIDYVWELLDKGQFYEAYQRVDMLEAVNMFYTEEELDQHYHNQITFYHYPVHVTLPKNGGYGTLCCYSPGHMQVMIDMNSLVAHVKRQLADPKVKVVPYDIAVADCSSFLMGCNQFTNDLGFGYSAAKKGFIRKAAKKVKTTIGKAPILAVQRAICEAIEYSIRHKFSFVTCTISVSASKREMNNAVVLAKKLDIQLGDGLRTWVSARFENGQKVTDGYNRKESYKDYLDQMADIKDLSTDMRKQLDEAIQEWWDNATEVIRPEK